MNDGCWTHRVGFEMPTCFVCVFCVCVCVLCVFCVCVCVCFVCVLCVFCVCVCVVCVFCVCVFCVCVLCVCVYESAYGGCCSSVVEGGVVVHNRLSIGSWPSVASRLWYPVCQVRPCHVNGDKKKSWKEGSSKRSRG